MADAAYPHKDLRTVGGRFLTESSQPGFTGSLAIWFRHYIEAQFPGAPLQITFRKPNKVYHNINVNAITTFVDNGIYG